MTTYKISNPPLTILTCVECGVYFGMSEGLHELRNDDGETFYCPSGHKQRFVAIEKPPEQTFSAAAYADNAVLKSQVQFLSRKLKAAEVTSRMAKRNKKAA